MATDVKKSKFIHADSMIIFSTFCLILLGTVMVYSASSPIAAENFGGHLFFLKKHLVMLFLGTVAMFSAFFIPLPFLKKQAFPMLVVVFILLLFVAFSSFGVEAKHATRWLSIGGFRFQPSEFAKPIVILFVASYIERVGRKLENFVDGLLPILTIVGTICLALLKQPDFGTAVTIGFTALVMLFVANARKKHIFALLSVGMIGAYFLVMNVAYRRARVLSFLDPWSDPQGKGFQIIQSFIAFKRGGLQGQGLGDGTQKLMYLPEAHTDFIYSVIAEELGFVGCSAVIVLFAILVFRGLSLALRIRDTFGSMLALGLTTLLGLQAFFNMAVVMGLLPTKGLTLPFVSYGGSALVANMFCIGLLLSLSASVGSSERMAKRRIG
jgi:cell division protein FtsW